MRRLLATLLARPSDSSLWLGGSGGASCRLSPSCWLCEADEVRLLLLRPLNMRAMRVRRADPDVSLRPSSDPRRLFDMRAPSAASLASESVVDDTLGLLERGRSPGVASDDVDVRLRLRPMAAMAGGERRRREKRAKRRLAGGQSVQRGCVCVCV